MITNIVLITLVIILILASLKVINQYERGIKLRFGQYVKTLNPGLRFVIPIIERIIKVDIRILAVDIPSQEIMTKDNVPIRINGVVFYKVVNAEKAVLKVENFYYAVSQLAQAALRDMCGKAELDFILAEREEIGQKIQEIVDKETDEWGIKVTDVKIKDIELPENMKRAMAYQAEAERNRRARVILASAEKQAAQQLLEAGQTIDKSPSALKLRLFQTLSEIAAEKNSTIVFPFPEEMLRLIHNLQNSDSESKN